MLVNPNAQDVKLIQTLMPGREKIYAQVKDLTYNGLSQFGPFEFCVLKGWIDGKTKVEGLVLFGTFTVEMSPAPLWWKTRGTEL